MEGLATLAVILYAHRNELCAIALKRRTIWRSYGRLTKEAISSGAHTAVLLNSSGGEQCGTPPCYHVMYDRRQRAKCDIKHVFTSTISVVASISRLFRLCIISTRPAGVYSCKQKENCLKYSMRKRSCEEFANLLFVSTL